MTSLKCNTVYYKILYNLLKKNCKNYSMHTKENHTYVWDPWKYFSTESQNKQYAVIVLNCPISLHFPQNLILNLWNNACLRVTVDGGTNRWLSWVKLNNCDSQNVAQPDLITGDMDSVSEETLNTFIKRNASRVIITADQNETDYTKALREVSKYIEENDIKVCGHKVDDVIVLADTSGRFDQIMANINTLFKAKSILPNLNIFQLGSNSLTWLLDQGNHSIDIPTALIDSSEWCSLIPMGTSCKVTTTGLKWDLDNTTLEFGKLVSTSNTYNGDTTITIHTDKLLVWSMGIESCLIR